MKLYEIIDTINAEYGVNLQKATLEPIYRAEVARLFDSELEVIPGAQALLDAVSVPMCVVSNGPVSKMQHSLGRTGLLRHFTDRLYSGYDIQRWKPDPALMFHAAEAMQVKAENCILVDDSSAGAPVGDCRRHGSVLFPAPIRTTQPIDHPKVTTFTDLAELPALWQARGWGYHAFKGLVSGTLASMPPRYASA
ncbi:phosphatase YieH [Klebsiella pneumoniae subsp. ozaenae]|uniref:Phosphatase YieH n=1 Tax=Klebsiella pneumoniae subsp. ozaenae TaxID=574 RepID=A0A378B741_KLEPO|nr:phosphatase YieH [Klebsiella pneumoniae subsp. ozaenae]